MKIILKFCVLQYVFARNICKINKLKNLFLYSKCCGSNAEFTLFLKFVYRMHCTYKRIKSLIKKNIYVVKGIYICVFIIVINEIHFNILQQQHFNFVYLLTFTQ